MAKWRRVHTKFWIDAEMFDLSPEDKLFYLCLLTNPKTMACGVYEVHPKELILYTGYNQETIDKLIDRFIEYGKIQYNRTTKEILIINWFKYNPPTSPKLRALIKDELTQIKNQEYVDYIFGLLQQYGEDIKLYRMRNRTEIRKTIADQVFQRDNYKCVQCGAVEKLTIDHIFPRTLGGTNHINNLRVLCQECNSGRPLLGIKLIQNLANDGISLDDFFKYCPDAADKASSPSHMISRESDTLSKKSRGDIDIDIDIDQDLKTSCPSPSGSGQDNPGITGASVTSKTPPVSLPEVPPDKYQYSPEFQQWWSSYPRKEGKKKASKCYERMRKRGFPVELLMHLRDNAVRRWQQEKRQKRYIPLAATFLGPDEPWRDYLKESIPPNLEGLAAYCQKHGIETRWSKEDFDG